MTAGSPKSIHNPCPVCGKPRGKGPDEYAHGLLEIKGHFTMQGPQSVSVGNDGGCPSWIADLLDQHPNLQQIALSGEGGSAVYSRMRD